ncbi:hypothetical protein DL96DRAFT_1821919 [Flagelloscypha sp. PMI_526]|nr:hypothetical protein DL96DRAFT_1821919 [Flagelloscypha sp. PMI_526]
MLLLRLMSWFSGDQTPRASLPTEIWLQILQHLDATMLWQLRFLCSTLRQIALDAKFKVLDLGFVANPPFGMPRNSWEPRLTWLENRLNLVEQPYISKRITSVIIRPHLEYSLNIPPHQPAPPSFLWRIVGYQSLSPPCHEKEFECIKQLTARLERLCRTLIASGNITSFTIISRGLTGGVAPPRPNCGYITSLLENLSPHLRKLKLDLSSSLSPAQELGFTITTLDFPHLETLELELPSPAHWCIPHLQHITNHSPRLHTVKLRSHLFTRGPNDSSIPTPICFHGKPLATIRILDINGGAQSADMDIPFDILPVLQQIEDLTIRSRKYHQLYIRHLNPGKLQRLVVNTPVINSAYSYVAEYLGGANSVLKELIMDIPAFYHDQVATTLPFFPTLKHLSLRVFSWDIIFLTHLPMSAPGLRTLSMCAVDSIILHSHSHRRSLSVRGPDGFSDLLTYEISTMTCALWSEWALETVEFSTVRGGRLSLSQATVAFAERLPNCRAVTSEV